MHRTLAIALVSGSLVAACATTPPPAPPTPTPAPSPSPSPTPEPAWPEMPKPKRSEGFEVPEARRFELSNGIKVTLVPAGKVPLVYLQLNVYTGAGADPRGKAGLADLTADLLNEGAGKMDALQISERLQDLASSINFGADYDYTEGRMECLEDKLDETLALMAAMVMKPKFSKKDFARVVEDRRNRLITARDDLRSVAVKVLNRNLFGDNYLGRPTGGTLASLKKIRVKDVKAWHGRTWRPDNAGIVMVGRLDEAAAKAALEKHFGAWKVNKRYARKGLPKVEVKGPGKPEKRRLIWVDRPGKAQTYLTLGLAAPAFEAEKVSARTIGNLPLGGQFTARINMNLREDKGYTYGAYSGIFPYAGAGFFRTSTSVKTDTTAASIKEILAEIEGILGEKKISPMEHAAAVGTLLEGYPASFERAQGILGRFGSVDANRRPENWLSEFGNRVGAVTLEGAQAALAEVVDPGAITIVGVGDYAAVKDSLAPLELGEPIMADVEKLFGKLPKKK